MKINTSQRKIRIIFAGAALLAAGLIPLEGSENQAGPNIIILPEVSVPYSITVSDGRIYVVDDQSQEVFMYARDKGQFLGKFGRRGQGPGEFASAPFLVPRPGELIAKSFGKVIYFSEAGEFRREIALLGVDLILSGFPVFPLGKRYVGFPFVRDDNGRMRNSVGRIYEEGWKPVADFTPLFPSPTPPPPPPPGMKTALPKEDVLLIMDYSAGIAAGDRIYFADSRKGFLISVYDDQGRPVREIHLDEPPVTVDAKFRRDLLRTWREDHKERLNEVNLVVADVYPALFAFRVDGEEIHAVTPRRKNGFYEIVTLSLEGKVLRRSFSFPLEPDWNFLVPVGRHFDIRDGILYTISFNEEKEKTELRIASIK